MPFIEVNLIGAPEARQFSAEVKTLLMQILPTLTDQRVAVGLDALLSAYITTVSQHQAPGSNQHAAACLRKAADLLEVGAFDQSPAGGSIAVH